jgi:hypothetical protein
VGVLVARGVGVGLYATTGVCVAGSVPGRGVDVDVRVAFARVVGVEVHVGGSTRTEVAVPIGKAAVGGTVAGGKGLMGRFGLTKRRA